MPQATEPPHGRLARWAVSIGDVASVAFPLAFVLTVWEIVARFFFARPTTWTLEIALLVSGIAYILTGPQAAALDSHIRIDAVLERLSAASRRRLRIVSALLSACFGGVIAYSGWRLAAPLLDGVERTGSVLNSPAPTIIKVLIPVVGLALTLLALGDLTRLVRSPANPARPGVDDD